MTAVATTGPRRGVWTRLREHHLNGSLLFGLTLLAFVLLVALVGPLLTHFGSTDINPDASLAGPSAQHWLGGDNFGRDQFARVAVGCRISLIVAVSSVALALAVGVPLGLLSGYFGGIVDTVIMRPLDVLMAFPVILLAIVVMAIFGTGTFVLLIGIAIVYVPIIARVMRASALSTRRELYVEAARSRGASHTRVIVRHVLPNSAGPVIVQASILMGIAILLEAALSFVGLGVRPPTASLGLMLSDGRDFMANSAWVVAAPGIALVLLVFAFTLIGDGLHAWLDPHGNARLR